MPKARFMTLPLLGLATALLASSALAESALRLPYPEVFGEIPAATYDERGRRVGDANLVVEQLDDRRIRLFSESGYEGGARTVATAVLGPTEDGTALRILSQESRSVMPDGTPMGRLAIDHVTRTARCESPNGEGVDVRTHDLPATDRVVNVPLNLFFQPLVRGDAETLHFQLFLCREGPRLLDFEAKVARRANGEGGSPRLVEVQYWPDFGSMVTLVAQSFLPKLSFWFDPDGHGWIGHRLPLYAKGPEVFVIRDGIPSNWLGR